MGCCYVRNGVWGWPLEAQEKALRDAGICDPGQLYRDDLRPGRAKKPSHILPEWLAQRATMLRPTRHRIGETIHVATLLALAVSEADLIAVLAAAEARQATVVALDSGVRITPDSGRAGAKAALDAWQRAKREAQTRPGRRLGNQAAAEKRRRRTLDRLPAARPLWRDTKPDRLTVQQIAEQVGLSGKTLYAELGPRPGVKGKRI